LNSAIKYSYTAILICLLFSCAQPGYLTGGEKDTTSPKVALEDTISNRKKEFPPNQSIHFSSERIEIHFDELITLKDEKKQIVITPTLETAPTFEVKGKKLFVNFETKPEPSTTYIINFGDAIRDVTEGNMFSNYKYVFSSGSYIDSLKYKGVVLDAFSRAPVADVWIMLYQELADSIPLKEKPYYFGKTNSSGSCTIENIATGTYKSFVLEDQNGNYRYDQAVEKIGFSTSLLNLKDSIAIDTFSLFTNFSAKSKLGDLKIQKNGKLTIPLSQPVTESLQLSNELLSNFWNDTLLLNESKDTVFGWVKPNKKEVKGVKFVATNFQSSTFNCTPPTDTLLKFTTNGTKAIKPNERFYLEFSQPLEKVDSEKLEFLINDKSTSLDYSMASSKFIIENNLHPDSSYILNALPGAFQSIYGNSNDSLSVFLNIGELNDFGNIMLNINQVDSVQLIIELLDKGKIVERKKLGKVNSTKVTFKNLEPKSYNIRIIFDDNNNGVWDTGNYFMKVQPEKIAYYSDPITVRKGWDLDLTWTIK
jgi:uncharacterized protein (DUF2141 family)